MTIGNESAPGFRPEARGQDYRKQADVTPVLGSAQQKRIRPGSKRANLLRVFLERGERGLNCFEAVRLAHDYVLRTSISDFRREFGIEFHRKYETVPGHGGSKIECVRYWLSPGGAATAGALVGGAA